MGENWTKISNFPMAAGARNYLKINALALYPNNNSVIYAAQRIHYEYRQPSRIWRTLDSGLSWQDVTAGLPDSLYFTSIAIDDTDSLCAWVTCGGFLEGQKVYRTRDGGATWENLSMNLPNIPVNVIVFQENNANDILYIGTDAGVYYYTTAGNTWELYSNLLPNVIVSDLEIHGPTRKLYAGTFGRGIWMTDLAQVSGIDGEVLPASRLSVYPNPAADQITIEVEGINSSEAVVEIISVTGQQIYLKTEPVNGNRWVKTLDPGLQSGLYFVRIWTGNHHLTAKFLVQ